MLSATVRKLFRRWSPSSAETALAELVSATAEAEPVAAQATSDIRSPLTWPPSRIALAHKLWGAGFISPGGEIEALRLTRPLGISNQASLLIVGVGTGGAASSVTRNLGAWVTGMECDPSLLAQAKALIARAQLTKKVTVKPWDPDNPDFGVKSHHHCLALEPFHGSWA